MNLLLYSPFAFIYQHAYPEHLVASYLANKGHGVTVIRCRESLRPFCQSMEAASIPLRASDEEKKNICDTCKNTARKLDAKTKYNVIWLDELLTPSKYKAAEELAASVNRDHETFTYEGYPFGRIALYETILRYKKDSLDLKSDDERLYFQLQLKNALLSYFASCKYLEARVASHALIYSPQYAPCHGVATAFESRKIPVIFLEAGTNVFYRLSTLRLWKWEETRLVNPLISRWQRIKQLPVDRREADMVVSHYQGLLEGSSHMVYSSRPDDSIDLRTKWGIPAHKKIIVTALSSLDEAFAAYAAGLFPETKVKSKVFKDQVAWIEDTLKFVADRDDCFLVVRVHPRDFPNKREGVTSSQARSLLDAFDRSHKNAVINWPSDKISIYDIYKMADMIVTGWSVTALEAGLLGIPVVTYDRNLPSYPEDMMLTGSTREEYRENLDTALKNGGKPKQAYYAFKWLVLNHAIGVATVSKNFHLIERKRSLFRRIRSRLNRKLFRKAIFEEYSPKADSKIDQLALIEEMLKTGAGTIIDVVRKEKHADGGDMLIDQSIKKIRTLMCVPERIS